MILEVVGCGFGRDRLDLCQQPLIFLRLVKSFCRTPKMFADRKRKVDFGSVLGRVRVDIFA